MSSERFSNKVVVVSGASSGIGAATVKRLATEGATLLGLGRNEAGLKQSQQTAIDAGATMEIVVADITSADSCRDAIAQCIEHFGRLDVLVNCAGRHVFRPLASISDQDWFEDLNTNLSGAFFLSQAAIPHLLTSAGNVVNIGSLASVEGQAYSATYCSAKHALIGLTRALALEFSKTDVRINAVCPGGTDTAQIANMAMPEDADFDLIMRSAGMRGFSKAEDIASVIAYVASDDAKAMHGAVIMADQGKTVG